MTKLDKDTMKKILDMTDILHYRKNLERANSGDKDAN